jgi:hypothetical protein
VTALARPTSNCTVNYRPVLSSERALQKLQTRNCLKEISWRKKNWSRVPDGRLTPRLTGRLTVGRKLTSLHFTSLHFTSLHFTSRKIQQHRLGTNIRVRGFEAGLLARSQFASEGPATGQLDQGFPWFSSVPEQMLSWYPNSTLHCILPMQPSQW